jgi:hypothetical protein
MHLARVPKHVRRRDKRAAMAAVVILDMAHALSPRLAPQDQPVRLQLPEMLLRHLRRHPRQRLAQRREMMRPFADMGADHPPYVVAVICAVFGGAETYSCSLGGNVGMIEEMRHYEVC